MRRVNKRAEADDDIEDASNSDTFREGGNPPQRLGAIFVSESTFSFLLFYFFSRALEKGRNVSQISLRYDLFHPQVLGNELLLRRQSAHIVVENRIHYPTIQRAGGRFETKPTRLYSALNAHSILLLPAIRGPLLRC